MDSSAASRAKLHNLCIDFDVGSHAGNGTVNIDLAPEDFADGDSAEIFLDEYNTENLGELPASNNSASIRSLQITSIFKNQGWTRPRLSAWRRIL